MAVGVTVKVGRTVAVVVGVSDGVRAGRSVRVGAGKAVGVGNTVGVAAGAGRQAVPAAARTRMATAMAMARRAAGRRTRVLRHMGVFMPASLRVRLRVVCCRNRCAAADHPTLMRRAKPLRVRQSPME